MMGKKRDAGIFLISGFLLILLIILNISLVFSYDIKLTGRINNYSADIHLRNNSNSGPACLDAYDMPSMNAPDNDVKFYSDIGVIPDCSSDSPPHLSIDSWSGVGRGGDTFAGSYAYPFYLVFDTTGIPTQTGSKNFSWVTSGDGVPEFYIWKCEGETVCNDPLPLTPDGPAGASGSYVIQSSSVKSISSFQTANEKRNISSDDRFSAQGIYGTHCHEAGSIDYCYCSGRNDNARVDDGFCDLFCIQNPSGKDCSNSFISECGCQISCSSDTQCDIGAQKCTVGRCSGGYCSFENLTDGTACSTSGTYGYIDGSCKSGVCISNVYLRVIVGSSNMPSASFSASSRSVSSPATPSSGAGGGTTTNPRWKNTTDAGTLNVPLTSGTIGGDSYNANLGSNERVEINVVNQTHYVGVLNITDDNRANVQISSAQAGSTPINIVFSIGEEKKFDLNNDNYYDLLIKLNSIVNGRADILIRAIHEYFFVPPSEVSSNSTAGKKGFSILDLSLPVRWAIAIVIVITLVIIITIVLLINTMRKRKYFSGKIRE